jgi:DNA invertase Pin-like site-specific DNA recombinase
VRFSTVEQRQGDSLRRQTEAVAEWCERNGVTLDAGTTLHDLGKSAFTGKHRQNADRNALAGFLKLVEAGKVPRGSYLILESLDRLTREHIQPALLLVLNLLQAGVRIVQLKPAEMVFDDKSDTLPVMMMLVELSRGHSESAMKSSRIGDAWGTKRNRARAGQPMPPRRKDGRITEAVTGMLPEWIQDRGGKLQLIPERAATVKHIYGLAAKGYGVAAIVGRLLRDNVPPFGRPLTEQDIAEYAARRKRADKGPPTPAEVKALRARLGELGRWRGGEWVRAAWGTAYMCALLLDRRAVGEYQPHRLTHEGGRTYRKPVGDPIKGYYPEAVTEPEWELARASINARRRTPGQPMQPARPWTAEEDAKVRALSVNGAAKATERTRAQVLARRVDLGITPRRQKGRPGERTMAGGRFVNIFAGLLTDARSGEGYYAVPRADEGGHRHVLVNYAHTQKRDKCFAFPLETFERAVLALLREVTPADVLPAAGDTTDPRDVLKARLDNLDAELAEVNAFMDANGFSASLGQRVAKLEAQKAEASARLEEAKSRAAYPAETAWKDFATLADLLDNAPDPQDVRLRLRAALRRMVDRMLLLVIPRGRDRLAVLQIWFADARRPARSYTLLHRYPKCNGRVASDGRWAAVSWAVLHEEDADGGLRELMAGEGPGGEATSYLEVDLDDARDPAKRDEVIEDVVTSDLTLALLDDTYAGDNPDMPLVGGVIPARQS